MDATEHLAKWTEAQAVVNLAADETTEKVSRAVLLALAYETLVKHPFPEVPYREQLAIYRRKVDLLLEKEKAHVFYDLEETEKPDYYPR